MIDVVFPCLDEIEALPWVLSRMPTGYRAIVADNGSTDGSAELARSLGALVVDVPQRGFGAAVAAGLEAATSEVVCICDADASLDPQQLPRVADPVLSGQTQLMLGSRRRPTTWRAWPIHARLANRGARTHVATLDRGGRTRLLRDLGPMRAARRQPLLDLGIVDRRFGYPLEMVLLAAAAGWQISEVPVGLSAAVRALESHRHRARHHEGDSKTCEPFWLAVRTSLMGVQLIVVAKEPIPGRVKTRLTPPFSPEQAADLAAASIADTLATVVATAALAKERGLLIEPVLALDGTAGPWLWELCEYADEFRVIAQPSGGLAVRLAAAFDDATADRPDDFAFLIGMDTPQLTPEQLLNAIADLSCPDTDAVLGMADDGGWWGLGLKRADRTLLLGVPMSTAETGREQYLRLRSADLRVGLLPLMRDIDDASDAAHVADQAPHSRFATTLAAMAPLRRPHLLSVAS